MNMNTANSINIIRSLSALSMLKSANKQPELALQLILQTLSESQTVSQTNVNNVPAAASAPPGTGQLINIIA